MSEKIPRKRGRPKNRTPPISTNDFDRFVHDEMERTGKTKLQIIEETFHDGFLVFHESVEAKNIQTAQLFSGADKSASEIEECKRLRKKFGPISKCVDYMKNMILGGGIDVFIDEPKNKQKVKMKEELKSFINNVYQDYYTRTLKIILDIMLDDSLTTGFSAAEIVFKKDQRFDMYATPKITQIEVPIKGSNKKELKDSITYDIKIPNWEKLDGIERLKILNGAHSRMTLYRKGSWEADYWALQDTVTSKPTMPTEQEIIRKSMGKVASAPESVKGVLFHPWQIFALSVNNIGWDLQTKGKSVLLPVLSVAQLLEKIMASVGEGINRAGNKKYFIICGTEKRPWSAIHIRNLLQQLSEAGKKGWSTIPVPAGFDIKEAGGEVFEAQNVIDYFLRIIAGTLHVPPQILGLDTKIDEEKTDELLRMKEAFKVAIQTQLFRLHIWTTFGEKYTKQGGSKDPQYVPEVRLMTRELMSDMTRLQMCKEILNVANPVRGSTKLEVEREIVKIMGWDVFLPTQEEYQKELEELDKQMKKNAEEEKEKPPMGVDEKMQGEPKAQTEEQQKKRLAGGVNVRKSDSKKGKIPSKDGEEEKVEETLIVPEKPEKPKRRKRRKQQVEIVVKTEPLTINQPEPTEESKELAKQKLENEKEKGKLLKKLKAQVEEKKEE